MTPKPLTETQPKPRTSVYSYEVIIIGAGPAGATLARRLAESGKSVLLLEKQRLPREKACGGGLPLRARSEFGVDFEDYVTNYVSGLVMSCGADVRIPFLGGFNAAILNRKEFDHHLVKLATDAGVVLHTEENVARISETRTMVSVITNRTTYTCSYVAACDGAMSNTMRSIELGPRPYGIAAEALISVPDEQYEAQKDYACFDLKWFADGYAWVFPREKGFLNVGAGLGKRKNQSLRSSIEKYASIQEEARGGKIEQFRGCAIPDYTPNGMPIHTQRVLACGDAASLVDPLTGEGLFYAARSANIAADVLIKGRKLEDYGQLIQSDIGSELDIAAWYKKKYSRMPKFVMRAGLISKRTRKYIDQFVKILAGESSYKEMAQMMRK